MPYPTTLPSEIKLFYQAYEEKNPRPQDATLSDFNRDQKFAQTEDEEATFFDADDELENSEPTSFAKFFIDTLCDYATDHPFQTVALLWAIKTLVSDATVITSYLKSLEQFIEKSFSAFPTVPSWLTQAACAYGTRFMLHSHLQATHSLVLASLTSLFSSAAAQPWRATYPASYNLADLNGQTGTRILGVSKGVDGDGSTSISPVGDVNGDGRMDFLLGSYGDNSHTGAAYLVYSGPWLNIPTFSLAALNGTTGVKFLGISTNAFTGWSVSAAGDVNGDGKVDFLIGAPHENGNSGIVYLVYGGSWLNTPTFSLAGLNGTTGVKILGVAAGDGAGICVSSAGDVNGDGSSDFLIGASGVSSNTGVAYLIYGGSWLNTPTFSLANLGGNNGIKILGVSAGDNTGLYVCSAGDVNGDGRSDLLISAPLADSNTGVTYLIYAGYWLSTPTFSLSSLNGNNGVKFLGDTAGEESGTCISPAGDINGDGKSDFLIGAPISNSNTGAAYLIYGGTWLNTSIFFLANLDGRSGVKFLGVSANHYAGIVGFAGDVNGDEIPDILIGAHAYGSQSVGVTYLVYGGSWLNMSVLPLANLDVARSIKFFGVSIGDGAGVPVCSAGDINNDGAVDIFIGAFAANSGTGAVYLVNGFGFTLWDNKLTVSRGDTVAISPSMLNCSGVIKPEYLIITANNTQHGRFELINNPGQAITYFTQQQINRRLIQFVHDGGIFAPAYTVAVSTSSAATISALPAQIIFNLSPPVLLNNHLTLGRGQTILLTSTQFNSSNTPAYFPANTTFSVSNIQRGHFENVAQSGKTINSFTQAEIYQAQIQFVHDGSAFTPSCNVTLFDPGITLSAEISKITFTQNPPALLKNTLNIVQGTSVVLSNAQLASVSIPYPDTQNRIFTITSIRFGRFEFILQAGQEITSFTQQQIDQGEIQFIHYGSCDAPIYAVTLSDLGMALQPQSAQVQFAPFARDLASNQLTITQGQTLTLGATQLASNGFSYADTLALQFLITNPLHIRFSENFFQQQDLILGRISVTHDGSLEAPTYNVSLINCRSVYGPWSPTVTFNLATQPSTPLRPMPDENIKTIIDNAIISGAVSGCVGIAFFVLKFYLDYQGQKRLKKILEKNNTTDSAKVEFYQNVILPIAEKVFSVIKVTGICSNNGKEKMNLYRDAVIHLVDELNRAGIDIELEKMDPLRKSAFLSTVARQTKQHVVPDVGSCSPQKVSRFFVAHASPEDIWNKSPAIAQAVKKDLDNASAREALARQSEPAHRDSMNMPLLSLSRA